MGVYSSGGKYKTAAYGYLAEAKALEEQQNDIEFRRSLLANIRQERIARAQLELGNYSDAFTSSSASGALANIDSSLVGETNYSYDTSTRVEEIQDLQNKAQSMVKKYAKQQKTRAAAFALTAGAPLAVFGGAAAAGYLGAGAAGAAAGITGTAVGSSAAVASSALLGAKVGMGIGQIASNTGQFETGIKNIVGGISSAVKGSMITDNTFNALKTAGALYQTSSVDPATSKEIANSQQYYYYSPTAGKAVPIVKGIFS